jgi:hypothetical protein
VRAFRHPVLQLDLELLADLLRLQQRGLELSVHPPLQPAEQSALQVRVLVLVAAKALALVVLTRVQFLVAAKALALVVLTRVQFLVAAKALALVVLTYVLLLQVLLLQVLLLQVLLLQVLLLQVLLLQVLLVSVNLRVQLGTAVFRLLLHR